MDTKLTLINEIKNFQYIYDKKHILFKHSEKKIEAWEKISKACHINVKLAQCMWKTIRDRYVKEQRKASSEWRYLNYMRFIDVHIRNRKHSKRSIENGDSEFDSKKDIKYVYKTRNTNENDRNDNMIENQSIQFPNILYNQSCAPISKTENDLHSSIDDIQMIQHPADRRESQLLSGKQSAPSTKVSVIKKNRNSTDELDETIYELSNYCKTKHMGDSDIAFGNLVVQRLKEIRKKKKNKLKIEITKILYEESSDE